MKSVWFPWVALIGNISTGGERIGSVEGACVGACVGSPEDGKLVGEAEGDGIGAWLGDAEGSGADETGERVGSVEGACVGACVGPPEDGKLVGEADGDGIGAWLGGAEGSAVGDPEGAELGSADGDWVGLSEGGGDELGSCFWASAVRDLLPVGLNDGLKESPCFSTRPLALTPTSFEKSIENEVTKVGCCWFGLGEGCEEPSFCWPDTVPPAVAIGDGLKEGCNELENGPIKSSAD